MKLLADSILSSSSFVYEGEGLYNSNGIYIYKGENVNNYVLFSNMLFRIVKINSDKTIDIVLDDYINKLEFNDISIDMDARIVMQDGEEINLTTKEYELLVELMKNKNKVLSRESLLENIWGYDYEAETNVIDVYIRHLRSKLKNDGYIQTVRGIGYVIR